MDIGTLCQLIILFTKISASFHSENVSHIGKKYADLVSRSTIAQIPL